MDDYYWGRYVDTVREFYEAARLFELPGLPPPGGRPALIARLMGTGTAEALHLLDALHKSLPLEGDVCEFGVCQGATSALMAHEIMDTDKRLWLFDSFKGLPRPTEKDVLLDDIFNLGSMESYEGHMACPADEVRSRLGGVGFPEARTVIVEGFIEDVIGKAPMPEKVSFAYVDFDFYAPISTALEFLDGALTPGGRVLVDDYGFFSAGAQTAVDEFLAARPGRYRFSLPGAYAGRFCLLERASA